MLFQLLGFSLCRSQQLEGLSDSEVELQLAGWAVVVHGAGCISIVTRPLGEKTAGVQDCGAELEALEVWGRVRAWSSLRLD